MENCGHAAAPVVLGLGYTVLGLGFWGFRVYKYTVSGLGFWGLGFRVYGFGFGVWGLGYTVSGLVFRVWGIRFGV